MLFRTSLNNTTTSLVQSKMGETTIKEIKSGQIIKLISKAKNLKIEYEALMSCTQFHFHFLMAFIQYLFKKHHEIFRACKVLF